MPPVSTNTNRPARANQSRAVLLLLLAGLAILTAWLVYQRQPHYQVQVFVTPGGWGYAILNNGRPFIHQSTIPGQPGLVAFATEAQARRVGERVAGKLQQDKALPTLTTNELRQLGVKIP